MAKPRNWDALKPATRKRYERAGVSRSDYMSGMSLKAARGHANTPEHPGRKIQPGQEQYYVNKIVKQAFDDRIKYRGAHDITDIPEGQDPVRIEDIEFALTLSPYELEVLAHDAAVALETGGRSEYWFLFYH